MTGRFQRLRAAFTAARAEPDLQRRERILLDASQGDPAMLDELRALLAAEPAPGFLEPEPDAGGTTVEPPRRLGEFELLRRIGSGSSAVVWLARQASLDRDVALKVLTSGPGTSPSLVERFHREPIAVAKLNHAHIVPVFAEGRADDVHWFAMQHVDGHSLDVELRLQRDRKPNDPVPLLPPFGTGAWFAAVARLCADAADALQCAHRSGIVHRDVKPLNLLLDRVGRVLVADFGIARDERFGSLTEPGLIAGTWHYMSPEQARVANTPVDHRTDVYSLGVVLYELLTLTRPYDGATAVELLDKIRRSPAPPVRKVNRRVPRDLETICMAAMARQPMERYQTAGALRDDLVRFLEHEAILQRPPTVRDRCAQFVRAHRLGLLVTACLVLAMFGGTYVEASLRKAELRREARAQADAVLTAKDLDQEPIARIADAWRSVRRFAADDEQCSAAQRALASYRDLLLADVETLLPAGENPTRELQVLRAHLAARVRRLLRAAVVFPDEERVLTAEPRMLSGQVTIEVGDAAGNAVVAQVACRLIDPLTGMLHTPIDLGTAPVTRNRLPEGQYRIVVSTAVDGTREFDRVVYAMHDHVLRLVVRPRRDTATGMAMIPEGTLQLPETGAPNGLNGASVAVPSFWLDRCETTIGEYRDFLVATGRPLPITWSQVVPARDDRKPVTGVTLADAAAYAEWMGKRLPTYAEWALAARGPGPSPRRFPWGNDGMHGNVAQPTEHFEDAALAFAYYLRCAAVVDDDPLSCTPEGVFEMFGNVTEWTSSFGVDLSTRGLIALPDKRIVAGHAWDVASSNPRAHLGQTILADVGPTHATIVRGFRCARSNP